MNQVARWVTIICALAVGIIDTTACASGSSRDAEPKVPSLSQLGTETGFDLPPGCSVVEARTERGIDTLTQAVVECEAEAEVDLLRRGGFAAEFRPGVRTAQGFLGAMRPSELSDVATAQDRWKDTSDNTWSRVIVSGTTPGGEVRLQIWSFTT